jgi:hypothetical protein
MNDRDAIRVIDDADLQGLAARGRSDEHRDVGVGMSSSETPCVRALASMSTQPGYA